MRDALRRTTDLIQNLRGFTRSAVRPVQEVELLGLLVDLQTLFRHDLHRRRIVMTVRGERCTVRGDAGRLSQVFINLLTNARDAMPDGGTIAVDVDAEDSAARVRVTDTGVGIAPDQLGRIFEFLYTTKGDQGTGYGLTISRDIVESHNGTIEVESFPGKGSTFTVRLPLGTPVA
jgi:signal transduction histidine kinase